MKKLFVITIVLLFAFSFVFAEEEVTVTTIDSKTSTLSLSLDGDAYKFGFSLSQDFNNADNIPLDEVIDINAGTVSLEEKIFYFFYKAITDASNVEFVISVTPMYLGGTEPADTDGLKNNKTINYTAKIQKTNTWDGSEDFSSTLNTSSTATTTPTIIKRDSNKYFANGLAQITISSQEALQEKVPGNYRGTITVTLQSEL